MNISKVKDLLSEHLGECATITYNLGRNKTDEYKAIIKELYDNVFLVELNNDNKEIKSFTYSDVITKNIKIEYWFIKIIIIELDCTN